MPVAPRSAPIAKAVAVGCASGVLVAMPALLLAIASGGAGHGHYVAARALFPASMLVSIIERHIGAIPIALALLQFPTYGGLLGWSFARRNYLPTAVAALAHLLAAALCFIGQAASFS